MPSTKNMETLAENVKLSDYKGKWLVLLFYPLDFTFVCPTELTAFSDRLEELNGVGAEVIGISTDSVHSHRAWIKTPRDKNGIEGLQYPLASDMGGKLARAYDILVEEANIALRGLYIINPEGISAIRRGSRSEHRTLGRRNAPRTAGPSDRRPVLCRLEAGPGKSEGLTGWRIEDGRLKV